MGAFGTNCALIYPGWASNFVVQSSGTLAPVSWIPLAATTTTGSTCNVMILPVTNSGQFFRLSQ
jgi:hypothetical protein